MSPPPRYAGWGSRAGAALLDVLMVGSLWIAVLIVVSILGAISGAGSVDGGLSMLLLFASTCTYYAATMTRRGARNGQTLGKQAAALRVVRDDGRPVTLGTVVTRDILLKTVVGWGTLGVGWLIDSLWPLGERRRRTLHDLAVATHVVTLVPERVPAPQLPTRVTRLAPALARHVYAARTIEARIAQLNRPDLSHDISAIVGALQLSATRAQLLYDALMETPVAAIEQRLAQLRGSGKTQLLEALEEQLAVQRGMQAQLERSMDEFERLVVELDTIRGNLVSASASMSASERERIAEQVRSLRDEAGALAAGATAAYG